MKFAVAFATLAAFLAVAPLTLAQPPVKKLRGAIAPALVMENLKNDAPFIQQGGCEAQMILEGTDIDHDLSATELAQVESCFVQSFNQAYTATGYYAHSFEAAMSVYHDAPAAARAKKLEEGLGKKGRHLATRKYVWIYGYGNIGCDRCGPVASSTTTITEEQAQQQVDLSDLHEDFVGFFKGCLTLVGFGPLDTLNIGFFYPRPATATAAAAITSTKAVTAAGPSDKTTAASMEESKKAVAEEKDSTTPVTLSESDIFLYGLTAEIGETDQGIVSQCFTNSYNVAFTSTGWSVDSVSTQWQLVISSADAPYLLLVTEIGYNCNGCAQTRPDDDKVMHQAMEQSILLCLQQSGSASFGTLGSVEVRSMHGMSNNVVVVATTTQDEEADVSVN